MSLLQIRNLSKHFSGLAALDDISLTVKKGEILSIIGPNGAGKSTLFDTITGFHKPTLGDVVFSSKTITGFPAYTIAGLGLSRVFQITTVFSRETVFENVMMGCNLHNRTGLLSSIIGTRKCRSQEESAMEAAMESLRFVGLESSAAQPAENLPQEAQKRLAIAIAIAMKPRLLLLDEPVGGMSLEESDCVIRLIERIRESGMTVCLIEHRMRVVMKLSDRIIVLNHGRKIAEGRPDEIRQNPKVIKAYLGESYVT